MPENKPEQYPLESEKDFSDRKARFYGGLMEQRANERERRFASRSDSPLVKFERVWEASE